ncbi:MAG TPA: antibiotic biosynthesis monooxygenase family protein [Terriglobales bacterium]|nr:antibiotic biosynthesis monooxygenase family protein [Terriglobales bacterium]
MAVTRINLFTAKPGSEAQLCQFLDSILPIIRSCEGCHSCRLLLGAEDSSQLAIIEEWESIAAHQAAARAIPQEQIAQASTLFAKPPTGVYYRC